MLAPLHAYLHAQEAGIPRFEIGPSAGYSYGLQSGEFPIRNGLPNCGIFSGGRIQIPWLGGVAQWQQLFADHLGLEMRLGWTPTFSRYAAPPTDLQRVVDTATHTLIEIEREFRLDATFQTISLDLLLRWRPFGKLALGLGPSVGYRVTSTLQQSDNVLDPDRTFTDGERSRTMDVGSEFTVQRFALGGALTVEYPLQLWRRATLVPSITLRGDILSAVAETNWRSGSAGAGASLLFDLSAEEDTVPPPPLPPDTVRPVEPPPPPRLEVALSMQGIDESGVPSQEAVVSVREVIFRKHTPLLPAIYFDERSDSIGARYARISESATSLFTYRSLAELGPLELSHAILNLVGYRMRDDRNARLTLHGHVSSDEPKELGQSRADAVRRYLTTVWGIARSRIEVRSGAGPMSPSDDATADGRSENRRVLFTSNSPDLLAPVTTERVVRDFNPPLIKLDPTIDAEAGVRGWTIVVRQGDDTMATFVNGGNGSLRSDLSWRLRDDRIDSALGRLVAELRVEDSTGQVKSATDEIGMRLRRDSTIVNNGDERRGEMERLSFTLVAFGYRSATGEKSHELWLEELAEQLRPKARVEIRGYTDRIGDDAFNLELSRGRAQYVADRLKALTATRGVSDIDLRVHGAGVDTGRFPNNLPEGRVLSRGATIVAEQPIGTGGEP